MVVKEGAIHRVDRCRKLLADIFDQQAHVAPSGGDRFIDLLEERRPGRRQAGMIEPGDLWQMVNHCVHANSTRLSRPLTEHREL